MRQLSFIQCFTVGCTNEAAEKLDGELLCTQCITKDREDGQSQALDMLDNMRTYGTIDVPKHAIQFPCKIKFTVVPYIGMPRTAVYDCADQTDLDKIIDDYLSDTTGNIRKVLHTVYTKPESK